MSRIKQLFTRKNSKILSVYCTAGYPDLNSTLEVMIALQESGIDMIELGMPYSDPLADGPVIQKSSGKAIHNGMSIQKLFEQLQDFRKRIHIPVLLMGYMNPILQFGFDKFCERSAGLGIDGLIIPDLPIFEYESQYRKIVLEHGLDFVFLITPETSEERIRKLDELSTGFVYAVSSSSTTGNNKDFDTVQQYLQRIQKLKLKNPVMVGFGIKDKSSFESACLYAKGAIIGTAFIKSLEENKKVDEQVHAFVKSILT